ncbi:hypothetical protein COO91_09849 (plasmid) [Nostoc flagelliforme CCNUN1]|uniref:Uncharacterized protein n=1 Tax=Nostoc flagelliforme CCNUN1 TaxID=2038116 RepID=A0A2K8T9C3_9NOSO|nr:hypothetical protein COO91_09849 [Nostoc flagelliforme CCNUN1]
MWNKDYSFKSYSKVLGWLRQLSLMQFHGSDAYGGKLRRRHRA